VAELVMMASVLIREKEEPGMFVRASVSIPEEQESAVLPLGREIVTLVLALVSTREEAAMVAVVLAGVRRR
jgi:hypothetical protein